MKLRPLLVSLAVLVPAAGVVWLVQRPAPVATSDDARLGQRVADPAVIASAARVRIKTGGKTLELVRDGERWTLAGTPVLPADASHLNRLATDLVSPKIERLVSSRPEKIAGYELDSSSVTFLDAAGKTLLDLDLGKTPDGGGRLIRYGEEPKAYLARLNVYLEADEASWRDTALVTNLKAEDIASVSIGFPHTPTPVVVSRPKAGDPWTSPATPAGQQIKASLISSQMSNLSGLRYTNVTSRDDFQRTMSPNFEDPQVTLTTFSGRTVKIAFARAPEPPPAPKPEVKPGETAPPEPPAPPRPVYVEVTDSAPDTVLAAAAKTHAFEVADWIFTALPAKSTDLFEPVPAPPTPPAPAAPVATPAPASPLASPAPATRRAIATTPPVSVTTQPVSVTTEPLTIDPPPPAPPEPAK